MVEIVAVLEAFLSLKVATASSSRRRVLVPPFSVGGTNDPVPDELGAPGSLDPCSCD
jgi:hypothetical protein